MNEIVNEKVKVAAKIELKVSNARSVQLRSVRSDIGKTAVLQIIETKISFHNRFSSWDCFE